MVNLAVLEFVLRTTSKKINQIFEEKVHASGEILATSMAGPSRC